MQHGWRNGEELLVKPRSKFTYNKKLHQRGKSFSCSWCLSNGFVLSRSMFQTDWQCVLLPSVPMCQYKSSTQTTAAWQRFSYLVQFLERSVQYIKKGDRISPNSPVISQPLLIIAHISTSVVVVPFVHNLCQSWWTLKFDVTVPPTKTQSLIFDLGIQSRQGLSGKGARRTHAQ